MLECRNNSYYAGYYTNNLSKEDHEKVKKLMDPIHFLDPIKAWLLGGLTGTIAEDIVGFALPSLVPTPPQVSGNNGQDVLGDSDCPGCGYDWDLSMSIAPGKPKTTVLGNSENVAPYAEVENLNVLHNQPYYSWEGMNVPFLRAAMYRGDTIKFVSNYELRPERLFASEVYYLKTTQLKTIRLHRIEDPFHP